MVQGGGSSSGGYTNVAERQIAAADWYQRLAFVVGSGGFAEPCFDTMLFEGGSSQVCASGCALRTEGGWLDNASSVSVGVHSSRDTAFRLDVRVDCTLGYWLLGCGKTSCSGDSFEDCSTSFALLVLARGSGSDIGGLLLGDSDHETWLPVAQWVDLLLF